jgi:hypothetical protein
MLAVAILGTAGVIQGKTPDKYHFKERIQLARKNRVVSNQEFNDCKIPVPCNS